VLTKAAALGDLGRTRSLITSITFLVGCASLAAAGLALLIGPLSGAIGKSDLADLVPLIAVIVPFAAFSGLLIEALRALHLIRVAAVLAVMGGLATATYLGFVILSNSHASAGAVLSANLVGLGACLILGAAVLGHSVWKWRKATSGSVSKAALLRATLPNLWTTLVLFAVGNLDMILLGSLAPLGELAVYGVAVRICTLLHVPLGVINAAFIPIAIEARTLEQHESLRRVIDRSTLASGGLAIAGYVIFALVGHQAILSWSPTFIDAYWLVLIIGFGKVFHACGGSAGVILMTWGDQDHAMRVTVAIGLVTLAAYIVGYLSAGLFGLAIAAALAEMVQTTLFVRRVRTRFFVDPFFPSAMRKLLRRPTA
jgi:O-antigen/teichoic acid export membrane protein